jgi:HEAT repeat protein
MLGRRRPNVQKLARRGKAAAIVNALAYRDEIVDREGHVFDLGVDVRRQAATALAEIDAPEAFDALVDALEDEALSVRTAAAEALGARGDRRAVSDLAWVAASPDHRDAELRAAARQALGRLAATGTAELLSEALIERGGGMDEARAAMDEALAREGEGTARAVVNQAVDYFDRPEDERCARAKRVVDWVGPRAVPALIDVLEDPALRADAAAALGRIHDTRASEPLIALLGDSDPKVRAAAAQALGAIKDPRAVEALVAAAGDAEYEAREAAIAALEGMWSLAVISQLRARLAAQQEEGGARAADPELERALIELRALENGHPPSGRPRGELERVWRQGVRRLLGRPPSHP